MIRCGWYIRLYMLGSLLYVLAEQRELEAAPSTMQTKLSSEVMAEYPAVKEEARAKTSKARNDITAQQDLQVWLIFMN